MKLHKVEVISRESFGDHVLLHYRWTGEAPEPGQFVMARAASSGTLDPFLCRPFFVHNHADGIASLLFEVRGRMTTLLAEESDDVMVSAPRGRGFAVDGEGPLALVGGGVWVSPLRLLSRRLDELGVVRDIYLEIPGSAPEEYAAGISAIFPDAKLVPTDGTPEALLDRLGDLSRYPVVCASGPLKTLVAVKEAYSGKVPVQLAVRERMACANGSCFGCAVPVWEDRERNYERACVEGPVFPAEVLAW